MTYHADCVPLFFLDPSKKVIGIAHSGWKGTAGKIGKKMIQRMNQEFCCRPEEILTYIGPAICEKCYEVEEDVTRFFEKDFFYEGASQGKYQLDLCKANYFMLLQAEFRRKTLL